MTERSWYVAVAGKREGPMPDDALRDRITRGAVNAETLVWTEGMSAWTKAGAVPGLIPPGLHSEASAKAGALHLSSNTALATSATTWPLFGWFLLIAIGQCLIVPAPWVWTGFYRWFIDRIALPNGKRVSFAGKAGDIWYVFILSAVCGFAGLVHQGLPLLLLPITALLNFLTIRWVIAKLRWDGQQQSLRFVGSYWVLLGWMAFTWIALLSIIGWAWVATAATRWLCRNIDGSTQQLGFAATGWGVLWRTLLFALACCFVIPIPWALRWYTHWMVSQFHLVPREVASPT